MSAIARGAHDHDSQMAPEQMVKHSRTLSSMSMQTPATATSAKIFLTQQGNYQRFVLPDPVAFNYLEEDRSTTVLRRNVDLEGYQCYLIEQWACSRAHPTFIVTTYTGDPSNKIRVGVLSVPADEETWSPRLRVYFKALSQYQARRRDTPLGVLMVTNLSSFPSSLTVIPIPDGDARKRKEDFFVNENLKRLGCSGRVGLSLAEPSAATQAKFHQLYKISDKTPLYSSVIEIVKLCQVALMLFGCLGYEYVDGLLCDVTEHAINDWWVEIGTELYNHEPTDGILGPSTVAALLGTLIGARNRLSAYGAPTTKDVFDVEATKRAIAYFQKSQRLRKNRRLDRTTLNRLHRATAKQASGDGWAVPRAVKSTVAELSGKGGEMVMDMVGAKEKASIAEVETVDIERFSQLVKGERAKWLWQGKARKRTTRDLFSAEGEQLFQSATNDGTEGEAQIAENQDPVNGQMKTRRTGQLPATEADPTDAHRRAESTELDPLIKNSYFNRAKGRFRDVVGIKGHGYTRSKDQGSLYMVEDADKSVDSYASDDSAPTTAASTLRANNPFDEAGPGLTKHGNYSRSPTAPRFAEHLMETPIDSRQESQLPGMRRPSALGPAIDLNDKPPQRVSARRSIEKSVARAKDTLHGGFPKDERPAQNASRYLRRARSFSKFQSDTLERHSIELYPRRLSFSIAEDTLLGCPSMDPPERAAPPSSEDIERTRSNTNQALVSQALSVEAARILREDIASLGAVIGVHISNSLQRVEELDSVAAQDVEQLNRLFRPRKDEHESLREGAREIVQEERARMQEALKDVETQGAKLQYEIDGLRSKVEDVEGAVAEYEKQVEYTEGRVRDLEGKHRPQREGWLAWAQKKCGALRRTDLNNDEGKTKQK